jgi:riboflavin kinase / FMN adenylyltransferase
LFEIDERKWRSVSSIGVNPTFDNGPRTVESFIFDFDADIYGRSVKLSFVKRIRHERKFAVLADLIAQMREDVKTAKALFDEGLPDGYSW